MDIVKNALPALGQEKMAGSANLFKDLGLTSMGLVMLAAEFETSFHRVFPAETIPIAWSATLDEWISKVYEHCSKEAVSH